MLRKNKTETIPFRDFMAANHTEKKLSPDINIYSLFPIVTPELLFPIHEPDFAIFVIGGGLVLVSVFFEKLLFRTGMTIAAETIGSTMKIILPIVGYGAIFWFLFSL
jgi:hypothetical protein